MKHYIHIFALLGVLTVLGGCASNGKLDEDINRSVSIFSSHDEIKDAFHQLENRIDSKHTKVTRLDVHKAGFDPSKTAVIILDWAEIGNKFTAGGNEVLADAIKDAGGNIIPLPVRHCLKTGKNCTAYKVKVSSTRSIEIPTTSLDTIKSVLDLKEVRQITSWTFSCIIVFNAHQAIYAQTEEDIAPSTSITIDKNSFLKKIGHAATP